MIAVGAPVHYYTTNRKQHFNGQSMGPYAAVITQVHGPECASLIVFPPFEDPYTAGSVQSRDAAFKHMTGTEFPGRWFEEVTLQVVEESEVAIVGLDEALAAFK